MNKKKKEKQLLVYGAAISMFAKYGYRKTTLEDIGDVLGMTKGNLYLYAKNKRDLYESSIAFALKNWQQNALEAAVKEETIAGQVLTYCMQGYNYLQENRDLHTLIINDPTIFPLSPGEDRFYNINLESMTLLKGMLKEGIKTGEFRDINIDDIAELLYSVYVMMIIRTYVKAEGTLNTDSIQRGYDLILHGLLKT